MNYLGLGWLPKKLSIVGIVFGIDNLLYRIYCANQSSNNFVPVGTLKPSQYLHKTSTLLSAYKNYGTGTFWLIRIVASGSSLSSIKAFFNS